jgi:hypothetical protein
VEIGITEQLQGTELMIITQAELQAEMAYVGIGRLTFLRYLVGHLVQWHLEQALYLLPLFYGVFLNNSLD